MMMSNGAAGALMSGSGPSVFGLFVDEKTAQTAYDRISETENTTSVFLTTLQEAQ